MQRERRVEEDGMKRGGKWELISGVQRTTFIFWGVVATCRIPDEWDPHVGVDEVYFVHHHGFLDGGHDAGVHARQVLCAVQHDSVRRALPLHGHPSRQQQVPTRPTPVWNWCEANKHYVKYFNKSTPFQLVWSFLNHSGSFWTGRIKLGRERFRDTYPSMLSSSLSGFGSWNRIIDQIFRQNFGVRNPVLLVCSTTIG